MPNKELLWKQYIKYQDDFMKKYGSKTIVLMQVGSFYEIYSIDCENYIKEAADVMGIVVTRKKNKENVNLYMSGVQDWNVRKFLDRLIDANYTVVIIDQIGPKNSKGEYENREITKIVTKSNVDLFYDVNSTDSNNLISVYIEKEKNLQNREIICIGFSVLDMSTGVNHIYEINSLKNLEIYEEFYRFVETFNPVELIINTKGFQNGEQIMDKFIKKIYHPDRSIHADYFKNRTEIFKLSWQMAFLKKIFPNTGMLNVVEFLGLEHKLYALNSYICLLQFTYEHIFNLIEKIKLPIIYEPDSHLILYNNTLYQLDVVPNRIFRNKSSNQYNSLLSVLEQTSTAMGKRELRERLLNPITNIEKINGRYNLIKKILNCASDFENLLKYVLDSEKYNQKLIAKIIQPKEFANLNKTYENIIKIFSLFNQYFSFDDLKLEINISQNDFDNFASFYEEYSKHFNIDIMIKTDFEKIERSFFNTGVYLDIDEIQSKIDKIWEYFRELEQTFSTLIQDYEFKNKKTTSKRKKKEKVNNEGCEDGEDGEDDGDEDEENKKKIVKTIYQEKKGKAKEKRNGSYFLVCTKRRADILKEILKSDKKYKIRIESHNTSESKIISDEINSASDNLINLLGELTEKCKDYYDSFLDHLISKYNFDNITKFITIIDITKCCAKVAKLFGYCCPVIIENEKSFINAVDLRHPIVERLMLNTNFVPNDIKLGIDGMDGILLYGINSCGKSVTMKSIGLNIIMAQAGMFVAAKEFRYYPYKNIFTRISGDDNLFYGQSSFTIEMNELRSILKYANENSLVLGDEVCRGTETISGPAIVASALKNFSAKRSSFIFATHLHQLTEIEDIKNLANLGIYHLSYFVEYGNNPQIIYKRKLEKGSGDSIYGIEVAKFLINNDEFIKDAYKIRNNLLNIPEYLVQTKSSKYNSNIYITDCEICGANYRETQLDTHHILFQSQCNENQLIEHIHKNVKSNLVVLCEKHHLDVHNGNLEITGYKDSSNGPILEYKFLSEDDMVIKKQNRLKFNDNDIKIIKSYVEEYGTNNKNYIIDKLKNEKDISIGKSTLNKIMNDSYK